MSSPKRNITHSLSAHVRPGRALTSLWYQLQARPEAARHSPPVLERIAPKDEPFKNMSFTFALIALSARVAMAEGEVTKEKYLAFREAFPLSGLLCGKLRALFILACANPIPYAHYVTQIKHTFPKKTVLFITLVDRLFCVAMADGALPRKTEWLLARISHMLGLTASQYSDIRARHGERKAHEVLELPKGSSAASIKKRYREMMRRYHPDRYVTSGLSPEVEALLQLKVSEINDAYRRLSKKKVA